MDKVILGNSVFKTDAFSEVAPVYTGGGIYVIFGKATTEDGTVYPFMADMDAEIVCLLNECPFDLPEDEQEEIWGEDWQTKHIIGEYAEDAGEFLKALCEYIIDNYDDVYKHPWSNFIVDDIERILTSLKEDEDPLEEMGTEYIDCPMCGRTICFRLTEMETITLYDKCRNGGVKIQDAFSYMNPMEREALKTGYCPECQKLLFSSDYTSDRIKYWE